MITDFRLRVFRTAAEKLSFTRAASELFITQPAVTKHVGELERQLGVALFLRRGGTISLTPEGERLLGYARRILSLYGELNEAFAPDGAVPGGEIALGASTTLSQYVLPAVLSRFRKRYADIRVTVADGNTERIERLVADERINVGLIEGQAARPSLRYETFMQDELVLVTSAGNRALGRDGMCAADLTSVPLVIRETGSGTLDVVERALAAKGLSLRSLNIEMQLGSTESIKHYLYDSGAAAFLSVQAIREELRHGLLRVIGLSDLSVTRCFSFVSLRGRRSRLVDLFERFCVLHARSGN